MLHTDGEDILNANQRTAFERWYQRGKGLVGIHAAANADRNWDWMTDARGGSLFNNHPAIQQATINITDPNHPSTQGIPANWVRTDEWYNFTKEPAGVHVLAKLDENTYNEEDGTPRSGRPPDRVVLELRPRPALLHGPRAQRHGLAGARLPQAHPGRHPVGRRREARRVRGAA